MNFKEWLKSDYTKYSIGASLVLMLCLSFCANANGDHTEGIELAPQHKDRVISRKPNSGLKYFNQGVRTGIKYAKSKEKKTLLGMIKIDTIALEYSTDDARAWIWLNVAYGVNVRVRHIGNNYQTGPRFDSFQDITFSKTFDVSNMFSVDVWHALSTVEDTTGITIYKRF